MQNIERKSSFEGIKLQSILILQDSRPSSWPAVYSTLYTGGASGPLTARRLSVECTGFVPGTPASVPTYPLLRRAWTHCCARTGSGQTTLQLLVFYATIQRYMDLALVNR